MLVIRVAVKVKPEEITNFTTQLTQEVREVPQQYEGCERFLLCQDVTTENGFLLYEEWQTQTHFDTYRLSDYFKENGAKIFPMLAEPPDSAYFEASVLPY